MRGIRAAADSWQHNVPLRCLLFGHTVDRPPYVDVHYGPVDAIGRIHADLYSTCARCGETMFIARIHVNHPKIVEAARKHPVEFFGESKP